MTNIVTTLFVVIVSIFPTLFSVVYAASVSTERLQDIVIYPESTYTGEVTARDSTVVIAQVSAVITHLDVMPGDQIRKDQIISVQDCTDYQAGLLMNKAATDEIRANLDLTVIQIERQKSLEKKQLTSQNRLDDLVANKKVLEAKLLSQKAQKSLAENEVERCSLSAPFDAVITRKLVGQGQWVSLGTPIYEIQRLDQAELQVRIPVGLASMNQLKNTNWRTNSGAPVPVKLLRISPSVDPQSKMQTVWFESPAGSLIGSQGTLHVRDTNPFVPSRFIERRDMKLGVFIDNAGVAEFKALSGAQIGRPAQVPENWDWNWKIIVEGQSRITHGEHL